MEKKIYILKSHRQLAGPYNLEMLKNKLITGSELIWFKGLPDWTPANLVDGIKEIADFTISGLNKSKNNKKSGRFI